jgi:type I restriction enzyme S subunit
MAKRVAAAAPINGPWPLPEGWRWERIETVAPVNPRRGPDNLASGAEVAFVPMAAVQAETGGIDVADRRPIVSVRKGFTRFGSGDVIFAKITPCMENGKIAVIPDLPHGIGFGSTEFHVLAPRDVSSQYLYHWVSQRGFRETAEFNMTGTAGQKRVPTDFMRDALVPVPPRLAQDAIVAHIDELFAEIDDGEAALAQARGDLATWRKALLKAAVTGELTADWRAANPSARTGADLLAAILVNKRSGGRSKTAAQSDIDVGTGELPALPPDWTWSTVGQIAHVTGGITKNATRDALPLRVPYLRVGNVYAGRVDLTRMETIGVSEGEAERSAVKDGDLLIVEGNGSIDQIGRSAIWDGQIDPCLHQNHLIKVRVSERRIAEWIQIWLQSPWGRKELEAQASSTSGLHTLSISKVAGLRCPVPPLAELEASLLMIQRLAAEATAGGNDLNAMKLTAVDLRQSILAAAFRGELA